jgi:hypothetical protein
MVPEVAGCSMVRQSGASFRYTLKMVVLNERNAG